MVFVLALGFVAAGLAGCSSDKAGQEKETGVMDVVATTGMIADSARIVGGDHVKVTGLMGPERRGCRDSIPCGHNLL